MAARSVSLVNRLELEFQGTIYKNAIAFGDVDGDGDNEALICNTTGQLFVFKGRSTKPRRTCQGLGCVTTILVGDARNDGSNVILTLNTEGQCFVFDPINVDDDVKVERTENVAKEKAQPSKSVKSSPAHSPVEQIKPDYKQDLPANPKMALLADINGDGSNELVVCYTDRYVRVFKWEGSNNLAENKANKDNEDPHPPSSAKKLDSKIMKQPSKDEEGKLTTNTLTKQSSKDSSSNNPSPRSPIIENPKTAPIKEHSKAKKIFDFETLNQGNFVMKEEFSLPGQVGSVAVLNMENGKRQLIASQPSGGYVVLAIYGGGAADESNEREDTQMSKDAGGAVQPSVYYPTTYHRLRNFKVGSEVLGSINRNNEMSGLFCICTVDGTYTVINSSEQVVNILPVSSTTEYKWFAVDQLDISMDGNDAIVLCSWDGITYVIDKDFETVSYSFGDNICGFRAGMYAVDAGVNVPCFSYVTFLNRLVLFYDVRGIYLRSNNLYETLIKKLQSSDKYGTVLKSLKDETGNIDFDRLRMFVESTLSS